MPINLHYDDYLAVITIDRQESLNALSLSLIQELGLAIDEVARSPARALALVGAGNKAFCAGADVEGLLDRDFWAEREGIRLGQDTFAKLDRLRVPSIAVLHGYALGGGLELSMSCTFRVATTSGKFGLPEVRLGLLPGYGGTQRLPRLVGESRALELIMTGRMIDAREAREIGLVNDVVEDGDAIAIAKAFADRFVRHSQCASLLARTAVQRALDLPLAEGLRMEADLIMQAFQTDDAHEGIRAFLGKRSACFTDR
ncbi:enoyl-CoA hydratase/isomerase family protein (plasmid) [Cupriavidus pinatubonensis]|uniref:enoyl-CoA hydratase/isomerase family protein n=1 Tax=Cupriavidus pinatubonensis TaxID=248026 RepID=UPI001C73C1BB|nr:enoyl-CoA hydratase-related protein [Cupriavidus pinatubonensis]QYY34087.1 enoyl-CoA hydratase/isomerase family protein [Cupriavidus pinatubonensis]